MTNTEKTISDYENEFLDFLALMIQKYHKRILSKNKKPKRNKHK